jgi:hypothetical protein
MALVPAIQEAPEFRSDWPRLPLLPRSYRTCWDYLVTLIDCHPWLKEIYESKEDYRIYLAAYW